MDRLPKLVRPQFPSLCKPGYHFPHWDALWIRWMLQTGMSAENQPRAESIDSPFPLVSVGSDWLPRGDEAVRQQHFPPQVKLISDVSRSLFFFFSQSTVALGGFPGASVVKNPPANAGDVTSIPGLGRSSEKRNSHPLQYSCLEIPVDRLAKGRTRLKRLCTLG